MTISAGRLRDIATELASKPGHEKVRALTYELLVHGLDADSRAIDFEKPLPEARGRTDALLGRTVFEFKRDLAHERGDAEEELGRYLPEREKATRSRFVGLVTDGSEWLAYELRDGKPVQLKSFRLAADKPRDLLLWLEAGVSLAPELPADPLTIVRMLGRDSIAYSRSLGALKALWAGHAHDPDLVLKRDLWGHLLAHVYGKVVGEEELWFQHTYLTIVAKTIALAVLEQDLTSPRDLLSGRLMREAGISGAVESDFFDWVLCAPEGSKLVEQIARQVARFKLAQVDRDVLKTLYESLIDPQQRHDLGEYYTPDWLAARICEHAIDRPLDQLVLDPACGSGTFLFHAVRRFAEAAKGTLASGEIAERAAQSVSGIDIHPVAVIIARVTYLLALGEHLRVRRGNLAIPVYLGDSLQWNVKTKSAGQIDMFAEEEVSIYVPPPEANGGPTTLGFPRGLCEDPAIFDSVIDTMLAQSEAKAPAEAVTAALKRKAKVPEQSLATLADTYRKLRKLKEAGRNHIWGYVARNLSRPIWLSSNEHKADVVVGNPPWLSLRYMDAEMQRRTREEMKGKDIWVGGKLATHQDLSGLFFARAVELYLKRDGLIAFVMPLAAMTRGQFEKFRSGAFGRIGDVIGATVRFTEAWTFDERVWPLFPVPSCVLFARGAPLSGPMPEKVLAFAGHLPYRDATPTEAAKHLSSNSETAPSEANFEAGSPYRDAFKQGATLVPRMLCMVEMVEGGRLGVNAAAPRVRSRRSNQEKQPWKKLDGLEGNVEADFIRPVMLGESIAPFRVLSRQLALIPSHGEMLSADKASRRGYERLATWLRNAEGLWRAHGQSGLTLEARLNFYSLLTGQFPIKPLRVLYSKAGTHPAACLIDDDQAIIDHKLYWMPVDTKVEGRYLCAIINSESARGRAAHLQSKGQWGARDFDKVLFTLPIPRYSAKETLHRELADAAAEAEKIAAVVPLEEKMNFIRARQRIRAALTEAGISKKIDALVDRLLD